MSRMKLTAQSFLVLFMAVFKFSSVSWWNSASPQEKSNRATGNQSSKSYVKVSVS